MSQAFLNLQCQPILDPAWQSMFMDLLELGPRYLADSNTATDILRTDSPMMKRTIARGMSDLEGTVGSKCYRKRAPKG